MRFLYIAAALVLAGASTARADFADGLRAFDAGNYAEAIAEWTPLATANDPDALLALAGLYRQGLGAEADLGKAIALYRRAAEQGAPVAQVNLGDFYARGVGVERDLGEAYMWLELAARQDHAWAKMRRDEIRPALPPAELADALRRADAWRSK